VLRFFVRPAGQSPTSGGAALTGVRLKPMANRHYGEELHDEVIAAAVGSTAAAVIALR
jgi:hypothetical protein